MLSFKHQNVMSLIGLCFDGDIPMIIMPFMSGGSVLEYLRKNRERLFLTFESSLERVNFSTCVHLYLHQSEKFMLTSIIIVYGLCNRWTEQERSVWICFIRLLKV